MCDATDFRSLSLFNLDEKGRFILQEKVKFSFKIKYCKRAKLIMLIQLVCLLSYFMSRDVTLERCFFQMQIIFPCE